LRDRIAWCGVAWRLAACAGVARRRGRRLVEPCARPAPPPGAAWAPACGHPVHAHAPQLIKKKRAGDLPTPPISPHVSLYLRR